MGCLNANRGFKHWFGNIHLSGPCNRSCYFCIGQHMMGLDSLNNLDTWPLLGLDEFGQKCFLRDVTEFYVTGTNTDPLLYKHTDKLAGWLSKQFLQHPDYRLGVRTNGAGDLDQLCYYNKVAISITSLDPAIYKKTMGGKIPDLAKIVRLCGGKDLKANIVLCPENFFDIEKTVKGLSAFGFKRVNVREPYGQPRLGNAIEWAGNGGHQPNGYHLGMPYYWIGDCQVTYWDVHYVEVESVNLYASGRVSLTYPITKGYSDKGEVLPQYAFEKSGRVREQWVGKEVNDKQQG